MPVKKWALLLAFCVAIPLAAQTPVTTPAPGATLSGAGTPDSNGYTCDATRAAASMSTQYIQTDLTGNNIWKCQMKSGNPAWQAPAQQAAQEWAWSIAPGLLAISAMRGPIYYQPIAYTYTILTVRTSGTTACTTAPTLVVVDLGTSASTPFSSGTVMITLALGTTTGVLQATGSYPIAAGHYIGVGFTTGVCITAPTIDATLF